MSSFGFIKFSVIEFNLKFGYDDFEISIYPIYAILLYAFLSINKTHIDEIIK